jgi:hypothetical protein
LHLYAQVSVLTPCILLAGSDHTLADESSKLMMELFPELKDLSDMHFREPCKKTRGRFKAFGFRPNPLEPRMRAHEVFRERVQRGVRSVADASLRSVPDLLLRLAPMTETQRADRRDCNRQLYLRMNSFKTQDPSEVRVSIMRDFLHPPMSTLRGSAGGQRGCPPTSVFPAPASNRNSTLVQRHNGSVGAEQVTSAHHGHLKGPPVFDLCTISELSPRAFATTIRSESTGHTGQTSLLVHS